MKKRVTANVNGFPERITSAVKLSHVDVFCNGFSIYAVIAFDFNGGMKSYYTFDTETKTYDPNSKMHISDLPKCIQDFIRKSKRSGISEFNDGRCHRISYR